MDNNKMARVAKNFDTFAKVGDKIAVAAGIVCAVTAILTLIFGNKMFEAGTVTLDLDFIKFHLSSAVAGGEVFDSTKQSNRQFHSPLHCPNPFAQRQTDTLSALLKPLLHQLVLWISVLLLLLSACR